VRIRNCEKVDDNHWFNLLRFESLDNRFMPGSGKAQGRQASQAIGQRNAKTHSYDKPGKPCEVTHEDCGDHIELRQ